jgi:hypothetical protein
MAIPGWLQWTFAVAMVAVAVFHLARLARPHWLRGTSRDVELAHAAMGAVMVWMLVGPLSAASSDRLAVLCLVPAAWFAWRALHSYVMDGLGAGGPTAVQIVGPAAMAYMLLAFGAATPMGTGMAMPGSSRGLASPVLAGVFVLATVGVAAWTVARQRGHRGAAVPVLNTGCQLAMSATTVCMLVAL